MNKRIFFPSLAILTITTITVVGCSKDYEFEEYDTILDINYNTPTTRSVVEDGFIGDSESLKRQYYEAIKKTFIISSFCAYSPCEYAGIIYSGYSVRNAR